MVRGCNCIFDATWAAVLELALAVQRLPDELLKEGRLELMVARSHSHERQEAAQKTTLAKRMQKGWLPLHKCWFAWDLNKWPSKKNMYPATINEAGAFVRILALPSRQVWWKSGGSGIEAHSCLQTGLLHRLGCYGLNFRGLPCNNAGILTLFQVWLFTRGGLVPIRRLGTVRLL